MMGLEALFGGDPRQQGILAAAAQILQASGPSRMPTSFGQILGGGLMAGQQATYEAQQRAALDQVRRMLMEEAQLDLTSKKDSRALKQQIDGFASDSFRTAGQQAAALPGGPTNANAARIGEFQDGFDVETFLNKVSAVAPLQALEYRKMFAKAGPKFDAGITWVNGPDGKPKAVRTADDGSFKVLDNLSPRDKLELANLGGKDVAYNPFGLQPGQEFKRTMTPDGAAADSRARDRLNFDKSQVGRPVFSAEAGGWVLPPSQSNPGGKLMPVAGIGGKAPTEFQGKSAAFGLRATEADKIISGLTGSYDPATINTKSNLEDWPLVGGMLGAAANKFALSDSDQKAEQAQRDFINAVLRQESGAAIGADEFTNARRQYFPQPGEGPGVIQQKARNRQLAIQGLQSNAGRAAMTAPPAAGGGVTFLGFE